MLVSKTWTTRDVSENGWNGTFLKIRIRKWRGYYLFGILPLYIVNYYTEYTRF